MNRFIGSGMLTQPGKVFGTTKKVLRFTLNTFIRRTRKDELPVWWRVPCVVFSPSEDLVQIITSQFRWKHVNLEGRINTSKFEHHGQSRFSTDVIVDERNIEIYNASTRPAMEANAEPPEQDQDIQSVNGATQAQPQENAHELHDSADSTAAA